MTNINKNALSDKEFSKLFIHFEKALATLDQNNAGLFISDLLGPEEKIMIVKRFSAVAMFIEKNSVYTVWQALKISPSTASKIKSDFDKGKYDNLIKIFRKNKTSYVEFWKTLEIILQANMPPQGHG